MREGRLFLSFFLQIKKSAAADSFILRFFCLNEIYSG